MVVDRGAQAPLKKWGKQELEAGHSIRYRTSYPNRAAGTPSFLIILYSFLFATLLVIDCTDQRADTGNDDIGVGAATPGLLAGCPFQAHIAASAGVGIVVQCVLAVMHQGEVHAGGLLDGVGHSIQWMPSPWP